MPSFIRTALLAVAAVCCFAASPARALDPKNKPAYDHWIKLKTRFKTAKTFSCDLFNWGFQSDHFIKVFKEKHSYVPPEKRATEPPLVPDWRYRIYNLKYLAPEHIMVTYKKSQREDTERGTIINKAVGLVLKHVPGTVLTYGHYKSWEFDDRGNKRRALGPNEAFARSKLHPNLQAVVLKPLGLFDATIKFPYITNEKFAVIPVPFLYKAAMKIMMIASRNEIYRKPNREMLDTRGYSIRDVAIHRVMDQFEHYFNDGIVTLAPSAQFTESDYVLNESTGWLTLKNVNKAKTIMKFVMIPKDLKKARGITKMEAFFDPKANLFYGLHEYENGKLVGVMQFQGLKMNDPAVNLKVWEDHFKGRKISETS